MPIITHWDINPRFCQVNKTVCQKKSRTTTSHFLQHENSHGAGLPAVMCKSNKQRNILSKWCPKIEHWPLSIEQLLTSHLCAAVQGRGMFFYPNGELYEGEWSNGLRSGWGKMHYKDGSTYEGQWLSDQHNGQGLLRLRKYGPPSPCALQAVCCRAALRVSLPSTFLCYAAALQQDCSRSVSSLPSCSGAGGSTGWARAGTALLKPISPHAWKLTFAVIYI